MPPTTEQIKDKPGFDVYAMMLILGFVFTSIATLLLNDDLSKNWNFWADGPVEKAVNITKINEDSENYPEYVHLTKIDLDEWRLCVGKDAPFPVTDFEWPAGYDPLKYAVKPQTDNLQLPSEQLEKLKKPAAIGGVTTPEEAPKEPVKENTPVKEGETKAAPPPPANPPPALPDAPPPAK
jgi:hypothetical protein